MAGRGFLILLLVLATQVHAQQYRWIDEKGRVQYTDVPPPPSAKGVKKKYLGTGAIVDGQQESAELTRVRRAFPVKLYTKPGCEDCDDARKFLNARGIPFTEILVEEDAQREELRRVTGRNGVPVMIVGNKMYRVFDDSTYGNALDAVGYPKLGVLSARDQQPPVSKKSAARK